MTQKPAVVFAASSSPPPLGGHGSGSGSGKRPVRLAAFVGAVTGT
eukprot:SAG31_NODE_187_length_20848_cov_22.521953_21_plen_45_part_00